MAAFFTFKGVQSTEMGVYVTQYPPVVIPEERVEFQTIPGRSGSVTLLEGDNVYEDVTLKIECFVHDLSRLSEISAWLRGRGSLVLGNDETKCYHARTINQIEFETIVRARQARTFTAVFRCDPFRYEVTPDEIVLTRAHTVSNPGSVEALPVIDVSGSGDIVLNVGDIGVTLTGISGTVTVDSNARTVYQGALQAGGLVTLNDHVWPTLPPGGTNISWTGSVTEVRITPNWRWL